MAKKKDTEAVHPYIPEMAEQLRKGKISRRDFVKTASLLGMSAAAAYAATSVPGTGIGSKAKAETPKKGGELRVSMNMKPIDDPATYDWSEKGNVARHITEPLVQIGQDGVAQGHLAESWSASEDLKTWTFNLRKNATWSNGDKFGADDVIYNFKRWLDPKTGSSNQGRFSSMTQQVDTGKKDEDGNAVMSTVASEGALEKVDDHTVRFHLNNADLALPESMADYPALIVHRRFEEEGGDLAKNPVGTGPYALKNFSVGESASLERRTDAAWWGGETHLDKITYIDHGDDPAAELAAFASGQIHTNYQTSVEQIDTIGAIPNLQLYEAVTAQTGVARMHVTKAPFDNKKLRQAIQACVDHNRMLEVVYRGKGAAAEDHHVAPVHPEYAELPKLTQDYDKAKRLMKEAGYADGIDLRIDCVANPAWEQNACKALAEMLKPAGINLAINIMPGGTYWDIWASTPFGFTAWTHRALGVQVLNLAYRSGVAWNETSYSNPEFDAKLDAAGAILDPNERRKAMSELEAILQEDSIISQSLWRSVFVTATKNVKGLYAQVALEHHYNNVWLDS